MSRPTSISSTPAIDVAPATSPASSSEAQGGFEAIAQKLAELQTKALLSALNAASQKNRTKAPDRTLTTAGAIEKVRDLPDIRSRLKRSEGEATAEVADIRARVTPEDLSNFDNELYDWVNAKA